MTDKPIRRWHVDLVEDLKAGKPVASEAAVAIENLEDQLFAAETELERTKASEEKAWRERNVAYAKVKGWEAAVYVEGLPLRAVRVDEWGPGEDETVNVPDVTPRKLTELLDEIARLRAQAERLTR